MYNLPLFDLCLLIFFIIVEWCTAERKTIISVLNISGRKQCVDSVSSYLNSEQQQKKEDLKEMGDSQIKWLQETKYLSGVVFTVKTERLKKISWKKHKSEIIMLK